MITTILTASGGASGALAGAAVAVVTAGPLALVGSLLDQASLSDPTPGRAATVAALAVAAGLALDLAALRWGRPRPLTHGGQVPREWSALLPARVVAGLYGARLGVGPLTILSTWTWWTVTLASALLGPGAAALVGATFGLIRMAITVLASLMAGADDHARWFGRLRTVRTPGWLTLNVLGLMVLAVTIAGCSDPAARPHLESPEETRQAELLAAVEPLQADGTPGPTGTDGHDPLPPPDDGGPPAGESPGPSPASTVPARLEDYVRPPPTAPGTTPAPATWEEPSDPDELAAVLPRRVPGFEPVTDPGGDRWLELRDAAQLQPDPTEEVALLETRNYRGGWIRAFRNPDNDVAVTSVYEFGRPDDAELYLEDGLIQIGGYGGRFFDLEALPGVRGFRQEIDHHGERLLSLGVAFQEGRRWFLLYLLGSPETVTPDTLVTAVTAQRQAAAGPPAPVRAAVPGDVRVR